MTQLIGIIKHSSVDFVRKVFATYESRNVVALLDPGKTLPEMPGVTPGSVIEPDSAGGWFTERVLPIDEPTPAQIAFTSGTEGKPKGIILSHAALANTVYRLNDVMHLDQSVREYVGVPVTFSFGLGRCRAVAAVGGKSYIPERGFNALEFRDMLASGQVNALSAVPTLLRILLTSPELLRDHGHKLRWMEIGSQFMSRAEKEQIKQLFPNARIVQHYGLTEASRTSFLVLSETEGAFLDSVGKPQAPVAVRLNDEGRIQIRGPHLGLNKLIEGRIHALTDSDGWLQTGDFGEIRDGYLFYRGRADDVINTGGIKIDPGLLEQEILSSLQRDRGVAVCRVPDAARGDGFFVAVASGSGLNVPQVEQTARAALLTRNINPGSSLHVDFVRAIPTTPTGKVQRRLLAEMYEPPDSLPAPSRANHQGVVGIFERIFAGQSIELHHSFRDLGGDSLNYVQMSIALEKELGVLPQDWDRLTLRQLAQTQPQTHTKKLPVLETNILLRAIAILFVVGTHTDSLTLRGATNLLFLLIGFNLHRFKFDSFIKGEIWRPLLAYIKVLIVPYFLLAVMFMLYNREFQPDMLLLYTNVSRLNVSVIFPFWFVQVLVQCLVITGLLFSLPRLRGWAKSAPFQFSASIVLATFAVRLALLPVWDTAYLRDLTPQRYMSILWLGILIYAAKTSSQKLLGAALGLTIMAFDWWDGGHFAESKWLGIGALSLLFVPQLRVFEWVRNMVQVLGSATFYIFVSNGLIIWAAERILHVQFKPALFLLAITGSVIVWWLLEGSGRRLWARLVGLARTQPRTA